MCCAAACAVSSFFGLVWFSLGAAFWIIDTINGMTIHGMYVRSHVYRLRMEKYTRLHIEREMKRNEIKQKNEQWKKEEAEPKEDKKHTHNAPHTTHHTTWRERQSISYMYQYVTHLYIIMCSKPYEAYTIHNTHSVAHSLKSVGLLYTVNSHVTIPHPMICDAFNTFTPMFGCSLMVWNQLNTEKTTATVITTTHVNSIRILFSILNLNVVWNFRLDEFRKKTTKPNNFDGLLH